MMIFDLKLSPTSRGSTPGQCANCGKRVYEAQCILDDCYNVWAGRCPYCKAINLLSMNHGLRGYDSQEMHLVLPTPEEAKANKLPEGIPLGESGGEPTSHGSPLGELSYQMRKAIKEIEE